MKRYYYTDPLAAAWMAKHHEMDFLHEADGKIGRIEHGWGGETLVYSVIEYGEEPPYYIHPDSLHLLEPRVGDVVTDTGTEFYYVSIDKSCDETPMVINPAHCKNDEIIQRNDIAFMWPESEEV